MSTQNDALLAGFHSTWHLVEHSSEHHLRLHLANLKTAKIVLTHLAAELDHLINVCEQKLAEHASLNRDVAAWEKVCTGRSNAKG